jgi:hypothetical protein
MEFKCNGEILEVKNENGEWEFVVDCCESLQYTFECIANALGVDYTLVKEN